MTEQLKAEAYVREQRPALMELAFGCEVEATNNLNAGENDYRDIKIGDRYICGGDTWVNLWEARQKERYKIIGHPINLQDIAYCLSDEARCELMDVYDFTKSPQEQEERVWEWFNKEVKVC